MKKRSGRRILAALLALGMFAASSMAACAEDLQSFGGEREILTEEASSFEEEAQPVYDGDADVIEDNEEAEASDVSYDDFFVSGEEEGASQETDVSSDEIVLPEEETMIEDGITEVTEGEEEVLTEEPANVAVDELEVLVEESAEEELLSEEALGDPAVPAFVPKGSGEVTTEPVSEEALGMLALDPLAEAAASGKYGPMPIPTPMKFDNLFPLDAAYMMKRVQDFNQLNGIPIKVVKSYKIVKSLTPDGKNKNVASISKKGVITAKHPGAILVCAYDAKKKPIGCFIALSGIFSAEQSVITKKMTGQDFYTFVYKTLKYIDYDGSAGEDYTIYSRLDPDQFVYKSSNKKVLSVNEEGKFTTGKNGTATFTITLSETAKNYVLDHAAEFSPNGKLKLKLKVKFPSVGLTKKISPGKTATITVKNACKENPVENVAFTAGGAYFTKVGQSGKYGEKIKIKASADGGWGNLEIRMKSGEEFDVDVYSLQTKKRLYEDVGKTGSYDTKTAKALITKINAERKKNGLSKLKQNDSMTAQVMMNARNAISVFPREEYESKQLILAKTPEDVWISDELATQIGVAVFCDAETGKYYLSVYVV